jgi:filamentous hemagglutinin family protein
MQSAHLGLGLVSLYLSGCFTAVQAQTVIPDGTLNTNVTQSGLNATITNGTAVGPNLFHSFREFSIPPGGSANFDLVNTPNVSTIFSRVTGGVPSSINGLIQTSRPVNFFLLNPNGILLGANARLNVGGSFLGTTANGIQFADGTNFNATDLTPPLLTISVPIGLQMGQNPGAITVNGPGHTLTTLDRTGFTPLVQLSRPGLQVQPGNTLALVGNDVTLTNGVLGAAQGRVEVGSVTGGFVSLNTTTPTWQLGYANVTGFGHVQLTGRSLLDVIGINAGSIQVQGQQISLSDGSMLLSQNQGLRAGGEIRVNAAVGLQISGTTADGNIRSGINSETLGPGAGSPIVTTAPTIQIKAGGNIFSKTFSLAESGDITITAPQLLHVEGVAALSPSQLSGIGAGTLGRGNSGNVTITAGTVQLSNGATLATTTFGAGASGQILVDADTITLSGISPLGAPSNLGTTSFGSGNSGILKINTRRLTLIDGGAVTASAYAKGDAGSVIVTATEAIEVRGFIRAPEETLTSTINSSVLIPTPGFRQLLNLTNVPSGAAGRVEINSPNLALSNGGTVTVRNTGTGQGGELIITADKIELSQNSRLSAETVSGLGGNISLNADLLTLQRNSRVTATAGNRGNGGNIKINAPIILGYDNSDIIANAFQGNGGNIQITTQGIFGLKFRDQLTSDNDITASSQFGINGTVQITNLAIDPSSGLLSLPVDVVDLTKKIADGCTANQGSSFVVSGRGGMPPTPHNLGSDSTWDDLRDLASFRAKLPGVTPTRQTATHQTAAPPKKDRPLIEATGWHRNANGQMELYASPIATAPSPQPATCAIAPKPQG